MCAICQLPGPPMGRSRRTVILDKSSDSGETRQSTRGLVSMQHTKLGKSERELFVRSFPGVEDKAMSRTVHRLHRKFVLVDFDLEHVFGVMLPMAGLLP
jgi:hypothetical protein